MTPPREPKPRTEAIACLAAAIFALSFLLPKGDAPWLSFWREWTVALALLLAVLAACVALREAGRPLRLAPNSLAAMAMALALLCWLQVASGRAVHLQDALLSSVYFFGFGLSVTVATSLPPSGRDALADGLAAAFLAAALPSALLAFAQWMGWLTLELGMPLMGGRPVAHMDQANLLCSLLIQGLCGAWRLAARRRLSPAAARWLGVPLLLAVVLTQSRVAWLVAFVSLVTLACRRSTIGFKGQGRTVASGAIVFVVGSLVLPWADGRFGHAGATLAERASEGRRPAIWSLFLDAAQSRPWAGWGVLQNGPAQYATALSHPSLGYYFSSAHNFVIDLMVWFGIPVGLLAGFALLLAVARRLARAPDAAALASAIAAGALVLHGLVELPLMYAYFLFPLGLLLGLTTPAEGRPWPALALQCGNRGFFALLALLPTLFLSQVAREYTLIENTRPAMEYDRSIQHSMLLAELPPPKVVWLDTLRDFHSFALLPLRAGLTAEELKAAHEAVRRLPVAPSIERYALLMGINGRSDDSREALKHLCRFEPPAACAESQRAWDAWRQRWPALPTWPAGD